MDTTEGLEVDADAQHRDLIRQVIAASMGAAGRLAVRLGHPLKEARQSLEVAFYHEGRRRGMTLQQLSDLMGVSVPTVSLIARRFKAHYAQPEVEHGLPRRILTLLWAAPITRKRLSNALKDFEPEEVDAALDALLAQGRVQEVAGRTTRYRVGPARHRMVEDRWMARLDGLNDLMTSVAQVIEARFLRSDERAFARTVRFHVLPEDLPRLQRFYEAELFALLGDLDARAEQRPEAQTVSLSILWTPEAPEP